MADDNGLFVSDPSFDLSNIVIHRRVGHVAVPYKHYILIWGGFMSGYEDVELYCSASQIWFYNCITEVWTVMNTKGDVPFANSGGTAFIIDDYLYVYGGVEELTSDLWRYACELHCLELKTLTWTTVTTTGNSPRGSDKAVGWVYDKKIYLFGGYGQLSRLMVNNYAFEVDPSNNLVDKGWNNQLSIYDPSTKYWNTPKTTGVPPRPRAAHAADVSGDKVYIFGGRLAEMRVNDMHVLDLKKMCWSQISINDGAYEVPEGRSWHSFNFISDKRAILFGGLNRSEVPCGDWWECEIDGNSVKWNHIGTVPKDQTLVWHKSVVSNATKELVIVGGVTCSPYNMKQENHVNKFHVIPFMPSSLLRLSLQEVVKKDDLLIFLNEDRSLPKCLLELVRAKVKIQFTKASVHNIERISVIS